MTQKPFVLVPPSEAKSTGGSHLRRVGAFDAALAIPRSRVVESLVRLREAESASTLESVLQVRGPLLARALDSVERIASGNPALWPAWRRYVGVVWSHLDAGSLTAAQRRRLLIPSGLYGVTTGADPIADYRLKMNITLKPLGSVANFWCPDVTSSLVDHTAGSVAVNLLPREHAACVQWTRLSRTTRIVDVMFVRADGQSAAGHDAKAVKGVLTRALLDHGLGAFDTFEWRGWHLHREGDLVRVVAPSL